MFLTEVEKEEACSGAVSWICVASIDEPAQAPVPDLFPFVSDRAGIEREKEEACLEQCAGFAWPARGNQHRGRFRPCWHEKRKRVVEKVHWICVASVRGELAQALVSNMFPLVSHRAGMKRGSVL